MAGETISQHYVDGFAANLALTPQQKEARLVNCVMANLSYTNPGKMFNADDVQDDDDEEQVNSRAPASPEGFHEAVRRVGFFTASQKGKFIDDLDKVRMLADPTSAVMQGMMATKNRATDDAIIAALFGSAREGETGGTTVAFDSANSIAADFAGVTHQSQTALGADGPLTIGKLIRAGGMLDRSELEGERFFIWSSKEKEQLLATTGVTSSDYAAVKALVNGDINTLLGFTFVRSERLPVASNIRSCCALIKQAMVYNERPIKNVRITQREDRSFRWYAYYEVERGALRRYDPAVIKVLCKQA